MDERDLGGMTPASFVPTPARSLSGRAECWRDCRDRAKRVGRRAVVDFQAPNPGLAIPQQLSTTASDLSGRLARPSGVRS